MTHPVHEFQAKSGDDNLPEVAPETSSPNNLKNNLSSDFFDDDLSLNAASSSAEVGVASNALCDEEGFELSSEAFGDVVVEPESETELDTSADDGGFELSSEAFEDVVVESETELDTSADDEGFELSSEAFEDVVVESESEIEQDTSVDDEGFELSSEAFEDVVVESESKIEQDTSADDEGFEFSSGDLDDAVESESEISLDTSADDEGFEFSSGDLDDAVVGSDPETSLDTSGDDEGFEFSSGDLDDVFAGVEAETEQDTSGDDWLNDEQSGESWSDSELNATEESGLDQSIADEVQFSSGSFNNDEPDLFSGSEEGLDDLFGEYSDSGSADEVFNSEESDGGLIVGEDAEAGQQPKPANDNAAFAGFAAAATSISDYSDDASEAPPPPPQSEPKPQIEQKNEKSKGVKMRTAGAGGGSSLIMGALMGSAITSVICLGSFFALYEVVLKESLVEKSDFEDRLVVLGAKIDGASEIALANVASNYVSQVEASEAKASLEKAIQEVKVADGADLKKLLDSITKIDSYIASVSTRIDGLEVDGIKMRDELRNEINKSALKSSEDNAARKGIVIALREIESLKKDMESKIESIITSNKEDSSEVTSQIEKLKSDFLLEVEKVQMEAEKMDKLGVEMEKRYAKFAARAAEVREASRATKANTTTQSNKEARTVASALGIDVSKGAAVEKSRPVYQFKGVVNGKVFFNMEPDPSKRERIRYYTVGDYIDGYGKITSVEQNPTRVMTEGGLVSIK